MGQQNLDQASTGKHDQSLRKKISAVKTEQEWNELLSQLPTAEYDSTEPSDPDKRVQRKIKNRHYDKRGMVVKNPDTSITLTEVLHEGKERWPLPTSDSDVILIGEVQDKQAYLSNDKSGVYTEFTISVTEVLKGDLPQTDQNNTITASRMGGIVHYPNGHKRLYLVSGEGLPLDSGQYVLFLKASEQDQTYDILTMYQLKMEGVIPIDEGKQFETYRGQKKSQFLKAIQDEIAKSSKSNVQ